MCVFTQVDFDVCRDDGGGGGGIPVWRGLSPRTVIMDDERLLPDGRQRKG